MNQKLLWKIESLWEKYYNSGSRLIGSEAGTCLGRDDKPMRLPFFSVMPDSIRYPELSQKNIREIF